ncbi:MAG: DUF3305 domain-containing protein [Gammaproteobacteria bacterium]|nr:DUF3305 domain-containing protein [Gammaproteobacteria bacterium]
MMQQNIIDRKTISAVMLQQESSHPWADSVWTLAGVIPGLSQMQLSQLESTGKLHFWPDLELQLHVLHCDAYYQNLVSANPQLYLISQQNDSNTLSPLLVTVDFDEAASYMETGAQVFYSALPAALISWLEAFVLTHYRPEKPKKRQRKKWHDGGETHDKI